MLELSYNLKPFLVVRLKAVLEYFLHLPCPSHVRVGGCCHNSLKYAYFKYRTFQIKTYEVFSNLNNSMVLWLYEYSLPFSPQCQEGFSGAAQDLLCTNILGNIKLKETRILNRKSR